MRNNTPKEILIHTSDVSYRVNSDQFKSINAYHRDVRGFPRSQTGLFVGYHRLITGGKNYKCKEDWEEGAHCNKLFEDGVSMNFRSLGVCVGFDGDIEMMRDDEYELLQKQVWDWQDRYSIPNERVKFHRDYDSAKTCPGSLLNKKWLETLLDRHYKTPQSSPPETAAEKPAEQCIKQEEIIKKQNEVISLFDRILKLIFNK